MILVEDWGMEKQNFDFDSRDGSSKIHASKWLPQGKIVAILQIVHGMAEYIDRYAEVANFFSEQGILVVGEDHLGHGKNITEHHAIKGYFCKQDPATVLVRDVHRLKKIIQGEYPGIPYFILGYSLGSFIVENYILRYGKGIQGTILVATGTKPSFLVKGLYAMTYIIGLFHGQEYRSKFIEKVAFKGYLSKIKNPRTRLDWLSVRRENVEEYLADPLGAFTFTINGYKAIFELLIRAKNKRDLKNIPTMLPMILLAGEMDPVGGYGNTFENIVNMYKEAGLINVSSKIYREDRHEILREDNREEVFQDILDWINHTILKEKKH